VSSYRYDLSRIQNSSDPTLARDGRLAEPRLVAIIAADVATLARIANRIPTVHAWGRRMTGSTSVPAMQAAPIAQHMTARFRADPRRLLAATTAATGIGQGAATPAPHPTRSPTGTESGRRMPNGSPGTLSRIDTMLPSSVAPAKAHADSWRCRPFSM
jgi:hypothetical protein